MVTLLGLSFLCYTPPQLSWGCRLPHTGRHGHSQRNCCQEILEETLGFCLWHRSGSRQPRYTTAQGPGTKAVKCECAGCHGNIAPSLPKVFATLVLPPAGTVSAGSRRDFPRKEAPALANKSRDPGREQEEGGGSAVVEAMKDSCPGGLEVVPVPLPSLAEGGQRGPEDPECQECGGAWSSSVPIFQHGETPQATTVELEPGDWGDRGTRKEKSLKTSRMRTNGHWEAQNRNSHLGVSPGNVFLEENFWLASPINSVSIWKQISTANLNLLVRLWVI